MAKYAVIRTDNLTGTDVRAGLVSVRYKGEAGDTDTEIENGSVVKLDKLIDGERELFIGKDVTANEDINDVVLLAAPEVMYDERIRNLDEYINEAGKNVRGYHFHAGDTFGLTKEGFEGGTVPEVGQTIELAAGHKLKAVASPTSGSTTIGTAIAIETVGRYTYYVVLVKPKAAAA